MRARCGLLVLLGVAPGCLDLSPALPDLMVDRNDPALRDRHGVLFLGDAPLSGYVVEWEAGHLRSRTPYARGRRHGRAFAWHENGAIAAERLFRDGDREGTHRGWWPDGARQFVYHYEHDLFAGEQASYYKNGVRAELRHYQAGHESGQQAAWDSDGRLAANYQFKEGRRYGIVGRFDCIPVHEN